MNRHALLFVLLLAGSQLGGVAFGAEPPNEGYLAAKKQAASRYAEDKKLCADESTSSARMQCLRDAKAEYNKALAAAKEKFPETSTASKSTAKCADCGKVLGIVMGEKKGKGGAIGTIGGGVAGALLGHQIGGGTGKDITTIAGAAGGAYAGYKAEEKLRSSKIWTVTVGMDSGEQRVIEFDHDPGLASGDLVRVSGNSVTRR